MVDIVTFIKHMIVKYNDPIFPFHFSNQILIKIHDLMESENFDNQNTLVHLYFCLCFLPTKNLNLIKILYEKLKTLDFQQNIVFAKMICKAVSYNKKSMKYLY